jgi:pimeloyl-ACP methyl ester carboxylesterase
LRTRSLAVALLACALCLPLTRSVARRFVFRTDRAHTSTLPRDLTECTFTAADGVPVHALDAEGPPGSPVVVHFHNNSDAMTADVPLARGLVRRGLGVLLVEYRGYGVSRDEPAPDEDGLYDDAAAALDWLEAHGVDKQRVVLWGTSLGTGVAAEMARRGRCAALVLVAPYTSIPDLVEDRAPMVPASLLVPDRFDTLAKTADIRVPTLVVHGDADEVVPFSMGERIATSVAKARLLRVHGGHHGDLFARDGEEILDEIARYARGQGDQRLGRAW